MKPSEIYYKALNMTLVEASFGSADERRERRATIASNPRLIRRLGALSLHQAVHFVGAEKVRNIYEYSYRHSGYEVLGHGYNATTIREYGADEVRKIIRGSDRLSEAGRDELAHNLEDRIAVNKAVHPDITIPTTVTIALSPVLNRPTVQLIQPFVASRTEGSDPRDIIEFAEKSLDEMLPTGLLPDVIGRQNLINTDDGIRLVDTVPVSVESLKSFGFCARRLYEMASTGK